MNPLKPEHDASPAPPIAVDRITVDAGRLACEITIRDPVYRQVWDKLAQSVLERHPDLLIHACVNAESNRFSTVLRKTSVPHLLEHLAIDIQAHESERGSVFVGSTEWIDELRGRALIQLSFSDDFEALRAFKTAVAYLNDELVSQAVAG